MEESRHTFRSLGYGCFEGMASIGRWPLPSDVVGSSAGMIPIVRHVMEARQSWCCVRIFASMLGVWESYTVCPGEHEAFSFRCSRESSNANKGMRIMCRVLQWD